MGDSSMCARDNYFDLWRRNLTQKRPRSRRGLGLTESDSYTIGRDALGVDRP